MDLTNLPVEAILAIRGAITNQIAHLQFAANRIDEVIRSEIAKGQAAKADANGEQAAGAEVPHAGTPLKTAEIVPFRPTAVSVGAAPGDGAIAGVVGNPATPAGNDAA